MRWDVRGYREKVMTQVMRHLEAGGIGLDIGAGDFGFTYLLAGAGWRTVGVDLSFPRGLSPLDHAEAVQADATHLPFRDGFASLVFVKDTLHHTHKPEVVLQEIRRVVRPNGHIVILEPNRYNPISFVHLTLLGGHAHFSNTHFRRMITEILPSLSFHMFSTHVYPSLGSPVFQRFFRAVERAIGYLPGHRTFHSYNLAIGRATGSQIGSPTPPERNLRVRYGNILRPSEGEQLPHSDWDAVQEVFGSSFRQDHLVLDVGHRDGTKARALNKTGARVVGLDLTIKDLSLARLEGGQVVAGDGMRMPFRNDCFDGVLCLHMLEHVLEGEKLLAESHRVLRPGGKLIVVTPNEKRIASSLGQVKRIANSSIRYPLNPDHIQEYDQEMIHDLFARSSFTHFDFRPLFFGLMLSIGHHALDIGIRKPRGFLARHANQWLVVAEK